MNTNPEYINNLDLEYLSNNNLTKNIIENNFDKFHIDVEFYNKRIIQITKDLCKNKYKDSDINDKFKEYASTIIYHLKRIDELEILQKQYENLEIKNEEIKNNNEISYYNQESLQELNESSLIKKKDYNLNKFVQQKKKINEDKIVPIKQNVDLNQERFRTKGVKIKK